MTEIKLLRAALAAALVYWGVTWAIQHVMQAARAERDGRNSMPSASGFLYGKPCQVDKDGKRTVITMDRNDCSYWFDEHTKTGMMSGFLPIKMRDYATYVFFDGVVIEDCWGGKKFTFMYDKSAGTNQPSDGPGKARAK
jgi:hypothetical protein